MLYVLPVVWAAVIVWGRRRGATWARIGGRLILAGALLLIVAFAILPLPTSGWRWDIQGFPTLVPFRTIRSMLAYGLVDDEIRELFGNIALFGPLGFALPLAVPRFRRAVLTIGAGAIVSLSVEVIQMFIPAHGPDLDDVILNTLGAATGYTGYAFVRLIANWVAPGRADAAGRV